MASRKANPTAARDALIFDIAQRRFFFETLETRNRDRLDFHDVAVWAIRDALEEAFEAGRRSAETTTPQS
ncbi:DUF6900 domain-containing protein [Paracoccus sp. (in: a-proteobacteria)]|uniref:DUF6900 domain-containing protein n=1 Tax=Paracoccus sp. TaxID=267 RepID=UPI002AFFB577|nr:hypothetical protein [Paracoccus sp. (in: a-proteobacteria)]